ncbi:MAG: hypothetical protein KDD56_08065, partial [Bdellovibrionales bacterium]|nr:hypothetical protein [Bdellovibrionales bacterium]
MARSYNISSKKDQAALQLKHTFIATLIVIFLSSLLVFLPVFQNASPRQLLILSLLPLVFIFYLSWSAAKGFWLESIRKQESKKRGGKQVLGMPPKRDCFAEALKDAQSRGKNMIDKYLVGFDLENGNPLWIDEDDLCGHGCVFAKTGVGKTLFL